MPKIRKHLFSYCPSLTVPASSFIYCFHLSALFSFIMSNMLFPPPLPWAVLVLQNRPNVCFPSKGWLSSLTGSISQATLRPPSVTACSCGGRSLITQACCFSCPLFTSSAEDLTGEAWDGWLVVHWRCGEKVAKGLLCRLVYIAGLARKMKWRTYVIYVCQERYCSHTFIFPEIMENYLVA